MSVRTRASGTGTVLAVKAFGSQQNEPPGMTQAAGQTSQMDMQYPFSPGQPVGPYDGYGRTPRGFDFTTGYNIATRPRTHERVSFDTLRSLIESYDVASICIWHKIDTLRGLKWKLIASDNYNGDVTGAVQIGTQVMRRPDRKHNFRSWFSKWFFDVLAYDAAPLFRLRNRAGRVIGLLPFDGTTVAPLLDYWGNSPSAVSPGDPEPEAYIQYVNGLPWNWLTRSDVIYEPFRAVNNSPYGKAPIESILLNANTDIRFQLYFLQRFTSGNVPEAFASAPEGWDPVQIEKFQGFWDSILYGDQSRKHQIRWMPGGAKIAWSNEKDFTDAFSLFMMRKTCACYHQVPTDLGFTETSNYSSGESQGDVQHKVGELPPMEYAEEIISRFLYDDLGLPVQFQFDRGEDQDDRLNQAESDQIYIQNAVVSASEVREMRFGLGEAEGQVVPRIFFSTREGPIPLNALYGVSGKIDPATAAPDPGTPLPHEVFTTVQGVIPDPPLTATPLAAEEYGPKAIPPAPPMQPQAEPKATDAAHQVAKEGESAPTAGVTSETGLYGYDLNKGDDEEPQAERDAAVAKELAAFRRFAKSRQRAGTWRDFRFGRVDAGTARALNAEGQQAVAKAASGYDLSPRAGMISLDVPDGLIEAVPGGVDDFHVTVVFLGQDVDDGLLANVCQRAAAAAAAMPGPLDATVTGVGSFPPSDGSDGKVPAWAAVLLPDCATQLRDGLADLSASEHADWHPHMTLAYLDDGDPLPDPLPPTPVTFTHLSVHRGGQVVQRFPLGGEGVAKAADAGPKAPWPGWELNSRTVAYWAPLLAAAASASLTASQAKALAAQWLSENPEPVTAGRKREANEAAADWLTSHGVTFSFADLAAGIAADGYVIGASSASSLTGGSADTDGWQPGDTKDAEAQVAAAGLAVSGADVAGMQAAYLDAAARSLTDSQGTDAATAGQALSDAVADLGLAQNVVLNQVVSASAQAAEGVYEGQGIEQVDILNGPNPCAECQALAASNPHAPGLVPVHPNCECSEVPHV